MKVVVVTGGIGSGKSLACSFLEREYGWHVYNADSKVKELYVKSPDLVGDLEGVLGKPLRDDDGHFVPDLLAQVIFSDRVALEQVESIVFPRLMSDFEEWKCTHAASGTVILESATILEKPSLKDVGDLTVVIDAPMEMRVERAVARDDMPRETVLKRVRNQPLMNAISEGGIVYADWVVLNDSTEDNLYKQLRIIAENLL